MPPRRIESLATSTASPEQAWAVVRDFCAPWHPGVAEMEAEDGGRVRRFRAKDGPTIYREELTWFSDSERSMGYRHLEGISGAESYNGRLTISPGNEGSAISMSAVFSASAARADEIAAGTQAIFDTGVAAIARLALSAAPSAARRPPEAHDFSDLQIDDLPRLAITHGGVPSDTLCLFLHGIGGNRSNWTPQMAALAPFCKVAALDLRGYGDSSLGPRQSSVDDYCDDVLRAAEALGCARIILCGLSFGAWIAASFAMRHPHKLAGLALCGGCTGMSEAGIDEREAFRLSREMPLNAGQVPADFAPSVVSAIAGPGATESVRKELLTSMQMIPADTYGDALRCFTNPLEKLDFAKITMPVLLMTGANDRLAPPAEIKSVAERIWDLSPAPKVRFEIIAGAGHVCNLENPARCNEILTEFVQGALG